MMKKLYFLLLLINFSAFASQKMYKSNTRDYFLQYGKRSPRLAAKYSSNQKENQNNIKQQEIKPIAVVRPILKPNVLSESSLATDDEIHDVLQSFVIEGDEYLQKQRWEELVCDASVEYLSSNNELPTPLYVFLKTKNLRLTQEAWKNFTCEENE